jgi:hypothetical protein
VPRGSRLKLPAALAALCASAASLCAAGTTITFGVDNGDLASGEIDLGDAYGGQGNPGSHTWVNPGGAGFDIRLTGTSWDGEVPAGSIKSRGADGPTVTFEFFQTGTATPVDVAGFRIMLGDLDTGTPAEDFTIVSAGVTQQLAADLYFTFGSGLSASDSGGDGISEDITSTVNVSGNDFGDARINALLDMGGVGISTLTFVTDDFVHIGNATTAQMQIIPEPATLAVLCLGGAVILGRRQRRQRGGVT